MNRSDFFEVLKGLFGPLNFISQTDATFALVNVNTDKLTVMQDQIKDCEDKIFHWLGTFDSQVDEEGRQNICNSVTFDFVVDPNMVQLANPNNDKIF